MNVNSTLSLRENLPEVRATSEQKLGTNFIYIVLQTSMRLLKEIIPNKPKYRKEMLKFI